MSADRESHDNNGHVVYWLFREHLGSLTRPQAGRDLVLADKFDPART
jgi:hypothetical protein